MQNMEIRGLRQGKNSPLIGRNRNFQTLRRVDAGPAFSHAHALGAAQSIKHQVEDERWVLLQEGAGALAEFEFQGVERGVFAVRQGCLYRFVVVGVVFVNDGNNFCGGSVYVHSVVVVREANGPVVDTFRFAVAQDGAHELFANVFAFEAGAQARAQSVAAFAVLGGNGVRCGGYRFYCRSARGGCGRHRCTRFRCNGFQRSGLRRARLGSCGCAR